MAKRMAETIRTEFDEKSLPRWARRHPEVIELARRDLTFRSGVCVATTVGYKRFLIRKAEAFMASRMGDR